jgi:hypothetical protein
MKKPLLAGAVACLALAAPPGSGLGQAPTGDSGFGSGHVLLTDFIASGHSGPNGENPVGSLTVSGFLNFTASATCSNVSGNAVVAGYRIDTGRRAGQGFLTSSVDNGPPRNGRPVDVTVYSGYVPKPPVNCPAPGDPPPPRFDSTGGGPFTSGDFTLVDARERLPDSAPAARVVSMRLSLRPRRILGSPHGVLTARVRICGRPGTALLRFVQSSSPAGRDRPVSVRREWQDQLRHQRPCETHRVNLPLTSWPGGRRYRVTLSARTSERRWSRTVMRRVDAL